VVDSEDGNTSYRFNTGEIVEDFVVLYKIEFKAPKFKWF